jgi:hypothetical protein
MANVIPSAERQFAETRLQVDLGLATIEESGALTAEGEAIAARMRATTDALLAIAVPPATVRAAEQALEEARCRWLERNGPQ